jgi:hypothetical protein
MTSQGSAHGRFQRAIERRNLFHAELAARKMQHVNLALESRMCARDPANGAAQESNLPTVGLLRLTGFEDQLGHRARPLRAGA